MKPEKILYVDDEPAVGGKSGDGLQRWRLAPFDHGCAKRPDGQGTMSGVGHQARYRVAAV